MSLLLLEGFDDGLAEGYGTWSDDVGGIQTNTGMPNGESAYLGDTVSRSARWILPSLAVTCTLGFRVRINTATQPSPYATIAQFLASQSNVAGNVMIRWDSSNNQLVCQAPYTGTIHISSGNGTFDADTTYYVECKVTINDTTGSIELRIDGDVIGTATSIDTRYSTYDLGVTSILLAGQGTSDVNTAFYDDVYVTDSAGSSPYNSFLGPIDVQTLFPDGNGNYSNLTGSDSNQTDNYLLVDESPDPDDDTTYVESDTEGDEDTYTFDNLVGATGKTIRGAIGYVVAKKTDVNAKYIRPMFRVNSTDYVGTSFALSEGYTVHQQIQQVNPNTSTDWTPTTIDGLEFGQEVRDS